MNIGTVTTGAAGTNASASITDDGNNSFTLNMTIPRGDTGSRGSTGPQGPTGPSAISVSSITTNGYIKFTNGLIIQWGSCSFPSSSAEYTFTYPITFPNEVFFVSGISASVTSWPPSGTISPMALSYKTTTSSATFKIAGGWTGARRTLAIGY